MNKCLFDLKNELEGISTMVLSLCYLVIDSDNRLTDQNLAYALKGVSEHIDRVANDIKIIDNSCE